MKNTQFIFKFFFRVSLATSLLMLSLLSCKKPVAENPFINIMTLDCRNLIIRNVALKDSIIEVAIENTCKTCKDDWEYLTLDMLNRRNLSDTLATTLCPLCLSGPRNGETKKYKLATKLTNLPDFKTVQFNFGSLCTDLTYLPKN